MVVVMKGLVVSGGPHRDALFVNGILGFGLTTEKSGGGGGGTSDESRSKQAKEGLAAMKRELGAAGVPPSSDSRRSVQEQQEISGAVKAGWHRQMAEEGTKERLKWARHKWQW